MCYRSGLRQRLLVRMRRVRVRRCRCCWCRVALWTGYTGSHLTVILSAWHLHLYSSLFVPVVDLLDVRSSVRDAKLWHVSLHCAGCSVCLSHLCSFSKDFPYSLFLLFITCYSCSCRCLPFVQCRQCEVQLLLCLYTTYLEQSAAPREVQYVMVIWTTLGDSCAPMNYCTWQRCAVSLSLFGHE